MSHDPWMEDSNSLDLTDSAEDRVHVPIAFTRDHADWLTADGQANFARGTEASVTQSQADAYAAMVMQDTLCSPLGLDSARPTLVLSDVRAQPSKKDDGYATLEAEGDLPDMTAIIHTLMLHRDFIMSNQMIYLIVDNRTPADVPHWPAFAAWWASRRCLVGPQEEATDILWVCADATTGLHKIPYYWAGVFVLEAARFLYPAQHFALIDNDCVPVTLFEVQDLLQLAHQQHQWVDLIGCVRSESSSCAGIGMLLFTEAHLEYNAGLVISIGNRSKHSPLEYETTAVALAKSLQERRLALVSRARPPVNPSDTAISGTMFTPFVGIAMQTALDLCMVWSLYGLYMRKHFWPSPVTSPDELGPGGTIKWPRQSHPKALTPEGRERTPWITSWARATFEQGILSVLPMLTGPCTVTSLPGEHLFQASALPRNRMRPAIFHAFGKAKVGAQAALRELELQGYEYWIGYDIPPLPSVFQINCGGLGGGALEGDVPPHFHCTCPPVGESQVYGPSLSPADVTKDQEYGVAYGCSTGVHEVATLFSLTQNPCQKWEDLGYGKAALLYQRTQHVLNAARLLPAHRRLPHQAFLSGLWWKLLSLQPLRLIAYLPVLGCLRPAEQDDLTHFTV